MAERSVHESFADLNPKLKDNKNVELNGHMELGAIERERECVYMVFAEEL